MFHVLAPPVDLQPFVRFFWCARAIEAASSERVIPDGCCELILHFGERPRRVGESNATLQPDSFLFGQIERAIRLEAPRALDVFGVRFTPAGIAALWSLDVSSIGARECALEDLFPARERLSVEQVNEIARPRRGTQPDSTLELAARAELVSKWLRASARVARRPYIKRATTALRYMEHLNADAARAAREAGVSRRGLERAFRSTVGLSPAGYLRLRRVEACACALRRDRVPLATIAFNAGYADQAHFSRDFRDIVGLSPAAYRREAGIKPALLAE